jgi:hypothetical protein
MIYFWTNKIVASDDDIYEYTIYLMDLAWMDGGEINLISV